MFGAFCLSPLSAQTETWVEGIVLAKNPERFMIHVEHETEAPGLAAGSTWFQISSLLVAHVEPGHEVRGRLVRSGSQWRLEGLRPYNVTHNNALRVTASQLRRDTLARGRQVERGVGERIPDFALVNQNGELILSNQLHGKHVLLNFVFSRCPQPDMCPAATARMIRLQQEAKEAAIEDFQLITITLDPEYDTPYILREYGISRGADLSNYHFLTGPEGMIEDLLKQFGIATREADGTIDHTMSTVLINPQGVIVHKAPGRSWSALEFLVKLREAKGEATEE